MQDRSLFPRLKAMFSTGVVVRRSGGKTLTVKDFDAIQAFSTLQNNAMADRYSRLHTNAAFTQAGNNYGVQISRPQLYIDYEAMDTDAICSKALDILSEEATQKSEIGEVLSVRSSNENIQDELYNLFYKVLNIEFNLPMWIRTMCLQENTVIPLLDGTELTIKELSDKFKHSQDPIWVYSTQEETNRVVPGKIKWCGITREDAQIMRVTLDDDTYVDVTPDHKFIMRDGSKKQACDLIEGESLMPFYTKDSTKAVDYMEGYEKVYNPSSNKYNVTHRLVAHECHVRNIKAEVATGGRFDTHHKNFNKRDNTPGNLLRLTAEDHFKLHMDIAKDVLWGNPEVISKRKIGIDKWLRSDKRKARMSEEMKGIYSPHFKAYNESPLHKEHNAIRSQTLHKLWESGFKVVPIQLDKYCISFIEEYIERNNAYVTIKDLCQYLKDNSEFNILYKEANSSYLKNLKTSFHTANFSKLIRSYTGLPYHEFIRSVVPHVEGKGMYSRMTGVEAARVLRNHKVKSIEFLTNTSDTYCMEVVGPNGEEDRHNFAVCSKHIDGTYTRNGVFVSNCKYGDAFISLKLQEGSGVYNVEPISTYTMNREEGLDLNNGTYIRFVQDAAAVAGGMNSSTSSRDKQTYENFEMAHFRLMTDPNYMPLGRSWFEPARKLFKQYTLLEDAAILHRVMRAPEKRVFYYNVGNIPSGEVDAFMQKQVNSSKKTPLIDPATGQYNLKFNMMNMMEDFHIPVRNNDTTTRIDTAKGLEYSGMDDIYYFQNKILAALAVPKAFLNYSDELNGKCLHPDTKIPLLDGTEKTIKEVADLFQSEEDPNLWVYSYDQESNSVIPGRVVKAEKTRLGATLVKVTLDNGEYIISTPDHGFVMRGGEKREAQLLKEGDSLQAVYREQRKLRNNQNEYEHVYQPNQDKWVTTHKMVDEYFNDTIENNGFNEDGSFTRDNLIVVHHADFDRHNNTPANLQRCTYREHSAIHVANAEKGIWSNEAKRKAKETKQGEAYRKKASKIGTDCMNKRCKKDPESKNMLRDIWLAIPFEEKSRIAIEKATPEMREKLSRSAVKTYSHRAKFMREGQRKWVENNPGFNIGDKSPNWVKRISIEELINFIEKYPGDKSDINKPTKLFKKMNYSFCAMQDVIQNAGWDIAAFFNEHFGFIKGRNVNVRREYLIEMLSGCETIKEFKEKYGVGNMAVKKFEDILGESVNSHIGATYNHKVVSVEFLDYTSDTYNMEVYDNNENHNFLTSAGVIVKNSTLAGLSMNFSKSIEKLQRIVVKELEKIAQIHLTILGYDESDLGNFKLSLTMPSTLAEQEKIALLKEKFSLMADALDKNLVSSDWCLDNILQMSEDKINQERELITEDLKRAFRWNQIKEEGNDPAISGVSYGTPHDLASIYKNNASGGNAQELPDGYDEKKKVNSVGRPQTHASIYGTDASSNGRDPFGKVDNKASDKTGSMRPNPRKPMAMESSMLEGLAKYRAKKVMIFEKEEKEISLLDERNILDIQ